ncbi:barstar family protein [Deinococcus deserti]|uniref:Barstar (barnase inhibitor) domain-containing protein n=1 Tax=Deinococcus deserti (strain DSM 17065 / CIP 109153 / LMG 22923 / VCD115) TaxID=546414 RepID=C1CVN3_DEIDV|nr:barstar family protein [Deinococcus deserti]ACO46250.1 hypothetical protein Deide_13140 [Deinococcus deserti VCD115]
MIQIFNGPPAGLQVAPHDVRILAAGHQVAVREVDFSKVHDKDSLMLAFLSGLGLTDRFGHNWDALFDVLTDPASTSRRLALVLYDYARFRNRRNNLSAQLESVLIDAQRAAAEQGRDLWLLMEEADSNTRHW